MNGVNPEDNEIIWSQTVDIYSAADSACWTGTYHRPATYAFDIYPSTDEDWGLKLPGGYGCNGTCLDQELFDEIGRQLVDIGNYYKPIVILEAPYNSSLVYNAISYAIYNKCLNIRTVMQWPAYWDGYTAPTLGSPPIGVHYNVVDTPNYMYTGFPSCWSGPP
jgi:hypothetical protein